MLSKGDPTGQLETERLLGPGQASDIPKVSGPFCQGVQRKPMPMGNVCPDASCGFAGKTKALSRDQSLPMPGKTTRVYQQTGLAGTACLELRTSYHGQTRTPNPCPRCLYIRASRRGPRCQAQPRPTRGQAPVRAAGPDHVRPSSTRTWAQQKTENKSKGQDESWGEGRGGWETCIRINPFVPPFLSSCPHSPAF